MSPRRSLLFSVLTASLASTVTVTPARAQRVRVAVLAFDDNSSSRWGPQLGAAATDELVTQLVRSGQFSVIERERIQAILGEQDLGQSGRLNPATAAELGKVLGVQVVLLGSITQFSIGTKRAGIGGIGASFTEAESVIDVRAVNTVTAEILSVAEGSGKKRLVGFASSRVNFSSSFDQGVAQEALRPAVQEAVEELVDQIDAFAAITPPVAEANIVGSGAGSYYIDRGENFGVVVGQRYDVYRVVDEIRDGAGNVLDVITDRVGVIAVTRVLSQSSVCMLVEGEAAEGDRVRPAN